MPTLLLLRHGESTWNAAGRFTGWVDVDLTPVGERRARHAGEVLREAGLEPTAVHTSLLRRSIRTGTIAAAAATPDGPDGAPGVPTAPVHRTWRLNERSYGALEGRVRAEVRAEVGEATYRRWRRSSTGAPPPSSDEAHAALLARLAEQARTEQTDLDPADVPRTESLADVVARLVPYWDAVLAPQLRAGGTPLVVGHSNSLRALLAHLDRLGPDEVPGLDVPTGMPLVHVLDDDLRPLVRGGRYLEPDAAARAAADVAAQGT